VKNRPIGIFDSGVGGLTVFSQIEKELPNENIIYFGDTLRVPYGPRPLEEVRLFVFNIIEFLKSQKVKLIVVACNTGTAAALTEAQQMFDIPIVGVIEPGARGAVMATKNRKVGVIGTKGTINSRAYSHAVRAFDAGVTVYSASCPKLVEIVEKGLVSNANFYNTSSYTVAKGYLTPILRAHIDTLILGCTHYPLLKGMLTKVCGNNIEIISSAEETAVEVRMILERKGQLRTDKSLPKPRFVSSGDTQAFKLIGSRFLGREINGVEKNILDQEMVT